MNILDIGANKGSFTDAYLSKFANINLILIEANPFLCDFLKNKYKNFNNVTVLNNLVSSESEKLIDFYLNDNHVISTASIDWITKSRFARGNIWYQPIKIKSISLDKLIEIYKSFDLIKIDVEGYELEVIKGLSKKHGELCFEWAEEEKDKINLTCKYLQNLGYEEFGYVLEDEYLKKPDIYTTWESSDFNSIINPQRKQKWGMIWVR